MKVPLSWLKEFVAVTVTPEELAHRLTFGGLEVAEVRYVGLEGAELPWDPEKIVTCNVLEVLPHPNAERLVLAHVDYGGPEAHTVVTGAPNLFPYKGQGPLSHPLKAVFAKEGARLYDGHAERPVITTLKGRPVRGVMSDAMLCSEKELGISDEHEGIIILEDDAPVGVPLCDVMGEVIFTLEITPNYARALSIVGVAREVAALTGASLQLPQLDVQTTGPSIEGRAGVQIAEPDLCPRFTLGLAEGVKLGPSPQWMQRRLIHAGMRPISNVVDISNYVMLEWGQPTHAFDYERVQDGQLLVRLANPGERLTTLDGKERDLTPGAASGLERAPLMVCDATGPLAVAGVMGGEASEVSATTTTVLLEAAIWEPTQIRKTARGMKLPSEASRRFERGVDYELPLLALRRCLELMRCHAGATIAQGFIDAYPRPWQVLQLDLSPTEVARILGVQLSARRIAELLTALGFGCQVIGGLAVGDLATFGDDAHVRVSVPSFRQDVTILADLCEEVARVYGYEQIAPTRLADELPPAVQAPELALEWRVREVLASCGLTELITHALVDMALVATVAPSAAVASDYVKLANPNTPEKTYMRRSLLPSLGNALTLNLRERERALLFEIGRVYVPVAGEVLPNEPRRLALALAGPRQAEHWGGAQREPLDFYDLKGIIEELVARLGLSQRIGYAPLRDDERFHPGRAATLLLDVVEENPGRKGRGRTSQQPVGVFGELHPAVRNRLELPHTRAVMAELDLEYLIAVAAPPVFRPLARFPATVQDLSIVAPLEVPEAQVAALIRRGAGELLEQLTLFDRYSGPQVGEGKRSLTYHLTFRAHDRTLTDEALIKVRKKIIGGLERELGATIRG
ncbi:phenylalanine--tRNA ligase subunit beta [Candidatus Viridilinea mediisalina]|uniref:Phenylalanine--tRNA ligase beta subunit n=1 Tax=Candidatus Viridilinea mediisalina TaxID=2024553 RepID=A0A2A6RI70_9CHLR|nr:phenylalanine--tRNA ligase subunit beta [Candidatus Viridilinea mediisalina]PDW02579.1 phenylalanine--tRNA ligase subunit beta [Candidatus Viridilinea mediisalina]